MLVIILLEAKMAATLNLKNESARNKLLSFSPEEKREFINECRIEDFLKSLKSSSLKFNDHQVFVGAYSALFVKGRLVRGYQEEIKDIARQQRLDYLKPYLAKEVPGGVVLTDFSDKIAKHYSLRAIILMNGDESAWNNNEAPNYNLVEDEELENYKFPVCSFQCLGQFYKGGTKTVFKKFVEGELFLLDCTPEETIQFTKEEHKKIQEGHKKRLIAPKLGFSIVNSQWHKSGFVLLHDKKEMQCILLGQDEGTYFGVQLPEIVNSIDEALKILVPSEVRGKRFARQGEWFIVEVKDEDLPGTKDRACSFVNSVGDLYLPLEDEQGNPHKIHSDEGFVGKDGRVFAKNPILSHIDHEDCELDVKPETYCTFYRNTAIRSFSQQGVD
jgi:hypothetical protein